MKIFHHQQVGCKTSTAGILLAGPHDQQFTLNNQPIIWFTCLIQYEYSTLLFLCTSSVSVCLTKLATECLMCTTSRSHYNQQITSQQIKQLHNVHWEIECSERANTFCSSYYSYHYLSLISTMSPSMKKIKMCLSSRASRFQHYLSWQEHLP